MGQSIVFWVLITPKITIPVGFAFHMPDPGLTVKDYFEAFPGTEQTMQVRGGEQIKVIAGSARLHVHAHGKKRFVIALKYEGEDQYRYIIASDLSWRIIDIMDLKMVGRGFLSGLEGQ
jgi:hypothetical protein